MATEWAILGLLRAEIEGRIHALTPHGFTGVDERFRPRGDDERSAEINKALRIRSFEVGRAERAASDSPEEFGTSHREPSYHIPISIVYPTHPQAWRDAAMSDAGQIRQDIDNNHSTQSKGVQMRFILGEPTFEVLADDPWEIMTLTLFARLDAEG